MSWFRCFVRGDNFLISVDNVQTNMGFYTTRYVSASDVQAAEIKCLAKLKNDKLLKTLKTAEQQDAMIYFEEIEEVKVNFWKTFGKGFSFFPMKENTSKET